MTQTIILKIRQHARLISAVIFILGTSLAFAMALVRKLTLPPADMLDPLLIGAWATTPVWLSTLFDIGVILACLGAALLILTRRSSEVGTNHDCCGCKC